MIQSAKRCLRKTIGSARLTYDELLTSVTEVEMILNSRPLTYLLADEVEGRRVLTLPDPTTDDDTSFDTDLSRKGSHS